MTRIDDDELVTGADVLYHVRRATAGDLPAVSAVLAENEAIPPAEPATAASQVSTRQETMWQRMIATADLTVYLAERGAEAVGTASMLVMPHLAYDCRPTAFIEAVVVRYAHRRRGVARLLLRTALEDARLAGCLKVQLLSHKRHADDGAHQLYRSAGFRSEADGFRLYLDPWPVR